MLVQETQNGTQTDENTEVEQSDQEGGEKVENYVSKNDDQGKVVQQIWYSQFLKENGLCPSKWLGTTKIEKEKLQIQQEPLV